MQKIFLLLALGFTTLLCGCDKQAKINSQKIDILTKQIIQLEQDQSKQAALLQSQLIALAPQLDKMNSSYFEKNRDDALFFHTNTLYLLLTIGQQIAAQLQTADSQRAAQNLQVYAYHTNEMALLNLCATQFQEAMTAQASRSEETINAETRRLTLALSEALLKQIKQSSTPDAAEITRRNELVAAVTEIQQDLALIKTRLALTNQPPPR